MDSQIDCTISQEMKIHEENITAINTEFPKVKKVVSDETSAKGQNTQVFSETLEQKEPNLENLGAQNQVKNHSSHSSSADINELLIESTKDFRKSGAISDKARTRQEKLDIGKHKEINPRDSNITERQWSRSQVMFVKGNHNNTKKKTFYTKQRNKFHFENKFKKSGEVNNNSNQKANDTRKELSTENNLNKNDCKEANDKRKQLTTEIHSNKNYCKEAYELIMQLTTENNLNKTDCKEANDIKKKLTTKTNSNKNDCKEVNDVSEQSTTKSHSNKNDYKEANDISKQLPTKTNSNENYYKEANNIRKQLPTKNHLSNKNEYKKANDISKQLPIKTNSDKNEYRKANDINKQLPTKNNSIKNDCIEANDISKQLPTKNNSNENDYKEANYIRKQLPTKAHLLNKNEYKKANDISRQLPIKTNSDKNDYKEANDISKQLPTKTNSIKNDCKEANDISKQLPFMTNSNQNDCMEANSLDKELSTENIVHSSPVNTILLQSPSNIAVSDTHSKKVLDYGFRHLKEEMKVLIQQCLEKEDIIASLEKRLKETEQSYSDTKRKWLLLEQINEKLSNNLKETTDKYEKAAQDLTAANALIAETKQAKKIADNTISDIEKRLRQTLAQNGKLKSQLDAMNLGGKNAELSSQQKIEELTETNKLVTRQKSELREVVIKQMRLVNNLKRQLLHLKADVVQNYTEQEVVKVIDDFY